MTRRGRPARVDGHHRWNLLWRGRRLFFLFGLLLVMGVTGVAYVLWQTPLPSAEPPLLQTTFVCDSSVQGPCTEDNSIAQFKGEVDRVPVRYEQIPPIFVQALLSAEDKDFFRHQGIDPAGVGRAFWANLRSDQVRQGGSTITQQYVKNAYLSNERTFERKLKESILAVKLERELPKQEILERYLNTIYFGRGAYGVEAASRVYFGKSVDQLGLAEASYLAGIIRAPETMDANRQLSDSQRDAQVAAARVRRGQVLDAMLTQGYITQAAHDAVDQTGFDYVLPRTTVNSNGKVARPELGTEYFLDYVKHWLVTTGRFTDAEIYGGGLRIYTTIDFSAQAAAYDAIRSTLDRPNDPSASIVSIDDRGRVRAMVGGFDYGKSQVNLAVGAEGGGGGRQPGSSFKSIVLAEYLLQGKSLSQVYDAPAKKTFPKADNGRDWVVANYGDAEQGQLNVVQATMKSSNTAYAQIMQDVGPQRVVDLAEQMGISASLQAYPSLVLGTNEVSVLDMAAAYNTLANEGARIGPFVVDRVTDTSGRTLWQAPTTKTQVLPKDVADTTNWVLNQVVEGGTAKGAKFGQPAAGKTGTTENYGNAWFAGFTCKLTAAVWVGYPDKVRDMTSVHGVKVAGGTFPATIWKKYMERAAAGLDSCPFEKPKDVSGGIVGPTVGGTGPPLSATTPGTGTRPTGTAPSGGSSSTTEPTGPTTTVPTPTTAAPPPTTEPPPPSSTPGGGPAPP